MNNELKFIKLQIKFFKNILSFLPSVFMMYMMIGFSGMGGEASSGLSLKVTEGIVEVIEVVDIFDFISISKETQTEMLHPIVRKVAHVTEYFILCILFILPLGYTFPGLGRKRILVAILLCFIFACSDEWHQTFSGGREGKVTDVLIDLIGICLASVVFFIKSKCGGSYEKV